MMEIRELQLPKNHQEILDRFIAACLTDDRIVAAFVGGSYAANKADQFSDLDLYFVTTDESYEDFLIEKESFLHKLGEPLFLNDFGVRHGYCFVLSNLTEGEFWFGSESKFKDIYSGPYKVLLDKKNILAGDIFHRHTADQAERTELLRRQVDDFWHELSHFNKALGRRQLWFAYGQIEVMRRICVILARLKHNFADDYLAEEEPHFKIEQSMPVEKLAPLRSTFCAMEVNAMLKAARAICRFYLDLAPNLAKEHNLPYQIDLEHMLMDQLQALGEVE